MNRRFHLPGFYIALVAMLFRAMLPSGWMPNLGGAPGTPIILCSLYGPVQIVLDPDGQPLKQNPDQNNTHQNDVCPFAAAPHFVTPVAAVAVPAPSATAAVPVIFPTERLKPASDFYAPQSPRGPPGIG